MVLLTTTHCHYQGTLAPEVSLAAPRKRDAATQLGQSRCFVARKDCKQGEKEKPLEPGYYQGVSVTSSIKGCLWSNGQLSPEKWLQGAGKPSKRTCLQVNSSYVQL